MTIRITQTRALPDETALDRLQNLILLLPEKGWPQFPYTTILQQRVRRFGQQAVRPGPLITELPNGNGTRVSMSRLAASLSSFDLLELVRRHLSAHLGQRPRAIAAAAPGFDAATHERIMEAITTAALAHAAPMPEFKVKKKTPRPRLDSLQLFGMERRLDLKRIQAEAAGNNLARELTILPPNELTPGRYRRRIATLAREQGWTLSFLDSQKLRRRKAGAFLAVTQGSAVDDAGIVHLRYRPSRRTRNPALALIGKGICYDTGGLNLKPARHMHGMHEDMAGSAVALGVLLALTRLRVPFPVHCWLPLAQNHIGPRAYKQNDVVTACDGTTIEIVHTDAEGRMVLADALVLAGRSRPALMIDYATLTGSCVYALGSRYSGAFTNRDDLVPEIIEAGRASGERVWPFPMDDDYARGLESAIADLKQCSLDDRADHILAARFLNHFANDRPWLHLDLASANHKGGLAHIPTDVTGFGIRFTLNLLLDRGILNAKSPS